MICINSTTAVRDDAELIAETLHGLPESFGLLVRKHQDRLYNAVVCLMGNMEDARDVVQETMLQAFRRLETFRQSSGFYTWLYRIAFNMAASHRRRKRFVVSVDEGRANNGAEPIDAEPTPDACCARDEQRQLVRQAIAQLPDEQRAVLVLREMDGLHYDAIAEALALPVGTVRSRLHRARMQLRELLQTS